ncbi:hypothetical protein BDZ91DRAFT_767407 [Kalaharituber pfeilii]|nr:hypothetical protein BDZ91DRAFT_767407 [Kalaharituber pfeilii]
MLTIIRFRSTTLRDAAVTRIAEVKVVVNEIEIPIVTALFGVQEVEKSPYRTSWIIDAGPADSREELLIGVRRLLGGAGPEMRISKILVDGLDAGKWYLAFKGKVAWRGKKVEVGRSERLNTKEEKKCCLCGERGHKGLDCLEGVGMAILLILSWIIYKNEIMTESHLTTTDAQTQSHEQSKYLDMLIRDAPKRLVIVAGDFNMVEFPADRNPPHADSPLVAARLAEFLSRGGLTDGWARAMSVGSGFTYFSSNEQQSVSRIDRLYVTKKVFAKMTNWKTYVMGPPYDHVMVIKAKTDSKGKELYRWPEASSSTDLQATVKAWDAFVDSVLDFAKGYQKQKLSLRVRKERKLRRRLERAQAKDLTVPKYIRRLKKAKLKLNAFLLVRQEKQEANALAKRIDDGESGHKKFWQLARKPMTVRQIVGLKDPCSDKPERVNVKSECM